MNNKDSNKKDINYWRGFNELGQNPAFLKAKEDEFTEGVSDKPDLPKSSVNRRTFLALLASSAALAATGCSDYRDKGAIVPYTRKPEEITIGNPNFYASTCTGCAHACGILIKTREGRPIKIDGNPQHPVNKGKICAIGQASVMNLYDPSRFKEPMVKSGNSFVNANWTEIDNKIKSEFQKLSSAGKEIAVISHTITSPTQKLLFDDFVKKYPTTKLYSYELNNNLNKLNAFRKSYGKDALPALKLNEAKIIVSLESDFLFKEGNVVENMRLYSEGRDVMQKNSEFNRLYVIEGGFSLTGANADYRIVLKSDATEEFAFALLSSVNDNNNALNEFVKKYKLNPETINTLVEDLKKHKEESVIVAGNSLPESTHIIVNKINDSLGSKINSSGNFDSPVIPLSQKQDIENLTGKMFSGQVGAVLHFDSNPVFHLSPDYKYEEALKKVELVISFAESPNESTEHSNYILPVNHNYESWGDHKVRTGVLSTQQPVIAPLYNTRQKEAILLNWINEDSKAYAENMYMNYLKSNWEKNLYSTINSQINFKSFWTNTLHDGFAEYKENIDTGLTFKNESVPTSPTMKSVSGISLMLTRSSFIGDGKYANNGWLMEMPNPITKVVWDNFAAISVNTAKELDVSQNDLIEISVNGKSITLPVFIQPNMADGMITTELGYGRKNSGPIAEGVGFNTINILSKNISSEFLYTDVKVSKTAGNYELVTTQEHYPIDQERYNDIHLKREIIFEGIYDEYKENPKFLKEEKGDVKLFNIVPSYDYNTNKWAMSIDLNKCTGCNYCVAACNVENNVPVVGKEQVSKNREMMWLRIDRYYSGKTENARINFQPMLCQHCDNAPCENVCPVVATTHSPDGLNQMTYNRCVGTRYCSNNCPYKVRRFNYFNFRDNLADGYYQKDSVGLMHNPEVTVRSRGVMEKCTFCVQRIMEEKQHATEQGRPIDGDRVKTACQEACPVNAIVFGDLTKKESDIVKYREHELGYHVLEEINVRPNVTYIAKLRNIKPEKKA